MAKYVCQICNYVYDEALGIPDEGIAPGTTWEELPDDWTCPLCGAPKADFEKEETAAPVAASAPASVPASPAGASSEPAQDMRELSVLEMSALCSNLARGCEKQYLAREAELFTQLAGYFKSHAPAEESASIDALLSLVESDLNAEFPEANAAASAHHDRGALRSLVWSEKVTRILKSLLARYATEKEGLLEGTNVYVCTICGFIFVGAEAPELCPVCKVPRWKFTKIEGR